MSAMRRVFGALQILDRRAHEVGHPGLGIWTDTGKRAAGELQIKIRDGAHRAEIGALGIEGELRDVLADGKVTPAELRRLKTLSPRARRVAEECHDVGEVVS